jgi:hypothetical protein
MHHAAAKLAGEHYCRCFTAVYGLETVRLRFFNIFGPRQDASSPYSGVIALFIAELYQRYRVLGLAYDRWRIDDLLREFDRVGLQAYKADSDKPGDGLRLVPWGQGFKDMGPAIDALEKLIFDGTLIHPSSPVLNWNMANAVAVLDPASNRKLDKDKARFRIDGAVALAMMAGLRSRDRQKKPIDIEALAREPIVLDLGDLRYSPSWDNLRNDSRFKKLIDHAETAIKQQLKP